MTEVALIDFQLREILAGAGAVIAIIAVTVLVVLAAKRCLKNEHRRSG